MSPCDNYAKRMLMPKRTGRGLSALESSSHTTLQIIKKRLIWSSRRWKALKHQEANIKLGDSTICFLKINSNVLLKSRICPPPSALSNECRFCSVFFPQICEVRAIQCYPFMLIKSYYLSRTKSNQMSQREHHRMGALMLWPQLCPWTNLPSLQGKNEDKKKKMAPLRLEVRN